MFCWCTESISRLRWWPPHLVLKTTTHIPKRYNRQGINHTPETSLYREQYEYDEYANRTWSTGNPNAFRYWHEHWAHSCWGCCPPWSLLWESKADTGDCTEETRWFPSLWLHRKSLILFTFLILVFVSGICDNISCRLGNDWHEKPLVRLNWTFPDSLERKWTLVT